MLPNGLTLDAYTTKKLGKILKKHYLKVNKQKDKLTLISYIRQKNHDSKSITNILDYVYRQQPDNLYKSCPSWLYTFLTFDLTNKKHIAQFVNNYGSILNYNHLINQFKNKEGNNLNETYKRLWNTSQLNYYNSLYPINIDVDDTKILSLNFAKKHPDINKFIKLRQQYASLAKNKIKLPELTIKIIPDKFGKPPHPHRVFNMRLNRLVKLQNYYKKNPPICHEDMNELNKIDLYSFNDVTREAYVIFLQNIFTIDDDGCIKRSNLLEKRVASSKKTVDLYKRVKNHN
jgi:hypothetical protein